MRITKQDIDKISQRVKTQMKFYKKAVFEGHWTYLPEVVLSLLKDPSVFVAQVARNFEGELMTIEKRLLRMFHSPKMIWANQVQAHLERLKHYVESLSFDKLLIYADISETVKRYAEKMPDLDRVRDGSESTKTKAKIQPGYWINEIYIQLPRKKIFPAIFYPFSTLEKGFKSMTDLILQHMTLVFETLGGLGLWISDRGYDNLKFFCASSTTAGNSLFGSSSIRREVAS